MSFHILLLPSRRVYLSHLNSFFALGVLNADLTHASAVRHLTLIDVTSGVEKYNFNAPQIVLSVVSLTDLFQRKGRNYLRGRKNIHLKCSTTEIMGVIESRANSKLSANNRFKEKIHQVWRSRVFLGYGPVRSKNILACVLHGIGMGPKKAVDDFKDGAEASVYF